MERGLENAPPLAVLRLHAGDDAIAHQLPQKTSAHIALEIVLPCDQYVANQFGVVEDEESMKQAGEKKKQGRVCEPFSG